VNPDVSAAVSSSLNPMTDPTEWKKLNRKVFSVPDVVKKTVRLNPQLAQQLDDVIEKGGLKQNRFIETAIAEKIQKWRQDHEKTTRPSRSR
jgi:hypothetical protein